MDIAQLGQYVVNGMMLGIIYAMVAVGFTLFFGVLDVIKFSHGDVLMLGAFTGYAVYLGLGALGIEASWPATGAGGDRLGAGNGWRRRADRPLRGAAAARRTGLQHPADHADDRHGAARMRAPVLPGGFNPKPFPRLLPDTQWAFNGFALRIRQQLRSALGPAGKNRRTHSPCRSSA